MKSQHEQEMAQERQKNQQNDEAWQSRLREMQQDKEMCVTALQQEIEKAEKERNKASEERDAQASQNLELPLGRPEKLRIHGLAHTRRKNKAL